MFLFEKYSCVRIGHLATFYVGITNLYSPVSFRTHGGINMNLNKIVSIFKTPKTLSTNKGFSLVELMVVVAIIGILASIAIPSVNKYMAKARQTEAKTNLSSLYTAEKAFAAEFNTYDTTFSVVGLKPEGKMRYNFGFATASGLDLTLYGYTAAVTDTSIDATTSCASTGTCTMMAGSEGAMPASTADTATFTAGAVGRISTGGSDDVWTVNQNKDFQNVSDGVNGNGSGT